jgi:putative RecB family exonuclease
MADGTEQQGGNGIDIDTAVMSDIEQGEETPQRTHSWSRLSMFQTCPQQYKLSYIDKLKGEVNPLTIVGRVCHDAIGRYNNHCIKNKLTSDFEKWKEFAWQAIEKSNLPPELNQEIFMLMEQYAQTHEVDLDSVVGAEEKMALNKKGDLVDWLAPDVWMRVILDYLQISGNVAKITDYKTTWAMKSDPFQLMIYAWAVKKVYPHVTDFQIEIDYIRHEFQATEYFEEDDMADIERAILAKTNAIENEVKFEPSVGIACSYCPVWYACPAMKTMGEQRRFVLPKTEAEAVTIALELEKTTRLSTEAKKVLKEYCDTKGDLVAGGRIYGFSVSSKYEFEIAEMIMTLNSMGINFLEYLVVDHRKFKALLQDARVAKIVKSIGTKKVSATFTSKKAGAKEESE